MGATTSNTMPNKDNKSTTTKKPNTRSRSRSPVRGYNLRSDVKSGRKSRSRSRSYPRYQRERTVSPAAAVKVLAEVAAAADPIFVPPPPPPPPPIPSPTLNEEKNGTFVYWTPEEEKRHLDIMKCIDSSSTGIQILGPPRFGYYVPRGSDHPDHPHFKSNITDELRAAVLNGLKIDRFPTRSWIPAAETFDIRGLPTSPLLMKSEMPVTAQYDVALPVSLEIPSEPTKCFDILLVLDEDPTGVWGKQMRSTRVFPYKFRDDDPFPVKGIFKYTFEFEFHKDNITKHGKNWVNPSKLGCYVIHGCVQTADWIGGEKSMLCNVCRKPFVDHSSKCKTCHRHIDCCSGVRKGEERLSQKLSPTLPYPSCWKNQAASSSSSSQ